MRIAKKSWMAAALVATLFSVEPNRLQAQGTTKEATEVSPSELGALREKIEKNPNDLQAHEAYIKATGFTKWDAPDNPELVKQYEAWMKQFPGSAAIPYAIGHAYASRESPKAKDYLLKAVALDPKFDKAYFDLWIDAERWGDNKAAQDYLLKAKNADPKNADYAFYYANLFSGQDYDLYKKLSLAVVKEFPETERGAQALYWLAARSKDPQAKMQFYEMQKKAFPADKFNWTSSGMSGYFDLLLRYDLPKALALAREMAGISSKDERSRKSWESNATTVENIMQANKLMKEGKAAEALAIAENVSIPRYSNSKEYLLLFKSDVYDAAMKTEMAYKNLLTAVVKEPGPELMKQLAVYGKKLGKNTDAVENDIWYARDTAAKQAPNFSLYNYFTKANTALSDYKGKVVLLTYWFPGCGPCRGEFPHFENVVRRFKGKDLIYLGINIVDEQDPYVLPFMKSTGYSFIPLRDTKDWKKGPLDNRNAAPVNFLIDGSGKIIFSNFRTDGNSEETLEIMIRSMLTREKQA